MFMTQKEYIENSGGFCPFCYSGNLEADSIQADGKDAWCDVTCKDCHKTWRDVYTLTGFEVDEEN
jgi:hypothetical protein